MLYISISRKYFYFLTKANFKFLVRFFYNEYINKFNYKLNYLQSNINNKTNCYLFGKILFIKDAKQLLNILQYYN